MDLLLIPVLLSLGGGLIYLSLNGAPKVSLEKMPLPQGFKRDPFKLNEWVSKRPAATRRSGNRISAEDAELIDLMNDMIAVREQLTDLRLARAPRPIRRRQARKPAITTPASTPLVTVELSVALEDQKPVVVRESAPLKAAEPEAHVATAKVVETEASPVKDAAAKLPHPVKAAGEMPPTPKDLLRQTTTKVSAKQPEMEKQPSEKQTAARRPSYTGHNRRYVRT